MMNQETMVPGNVKEVSLIRSQFLIRLIKANTTIFVGPRAGGKTSGGIAPHIQDLAESMSQSQIGLLTDTYERLKNVLVPGIESYWLNELGLIEGNDYVKFKKPPDHFDKPYFPIAKFDHVITFRTGTSIVLLSEQIQGTANGFNLQALVVDEAKFLDEKKIRAEVYPAIRGGNSKWGHLSQFQSKWYFTDKWGANYRWVADKKKDMDQEKVDIVYTLALEVIRLREEMDSVSSSSTKNVYKKQIDEIEGMLNELRKDLVYFCEALPYENKENLGDKYYADQKRDLSVQEYAVAIENKDLTSAEPEKAFYSGLTPANHFKRAHAYDPNRSLIIALDYQWIFTPLLVAQWDVITPRLQMSLAFINEILAYAPEGVESVLDKFCETYKYHRDKTVYYLYDHTATAKRSTGKTYNETVPDYLILKGWNPVPIHMGEAPDHHIKHPNINRYLLHRGEANILIDEDRCPKLLNSMNLTEAYLVNGVTKKDKRCEKDNVTPPDEATHLPDTFDQIAWGVLELKLVPLYYDPGIT